MSGICGIFSFTNHYQLTKADLIRMLHTLAHRGRDYSNTYCDRQIMFGYHGLNFLRAHEGIQPASIEKGGFHIILDGEIYNINHIKSHLLKKLNMNKLTDTEAILHIYKNKQYDFCNELNGTFAFAIWDKKNKMLFCARDRAGQKPFYYILDHHYFIFASEPKAILKLTSNANTMNYHSLMKYFTFDYVPYPDTIYSKIKQLSPGESIIINKHGEMKAQRYWDIPYTKYYNAIQPAENMDIICKNIISQLRQAIELRLKGNMPIGAFVSGGIDSSAIISLMRHLLNSKEINTFSVKFNEKSFDESEQVNEITKLYNTNHHMITVGPQDLIENISDILQIIDEPVGDASILPRFILSRLAKEYVSVVLTGDGGDEIFAGYPAFIGQAFTPYFNKLPKSMINAMLDYIDRLPAKSTNYGIDYLLKQFLSGLGNETEIMAQIWHGNFQLNDLKHLFKEDLYEYITHECIFKELIEFSNRSKTIYKKDSITRLLYFYFRYLLSGDLPKVDRMNISNSIEVRCPFLDKDMIEYVVKIKPDIKFRHLKLKYILRKALKGWVPDAILNKRKMGYTVPVGNWFRTDLKPMILDTLSSAYLKKQGLFNEKYVEALIKDHMDNKTDNRKKLWSLFFFNLWYNKYIE